MSVRPTWEPDDRLSAYLDEELDENERTELSGELRADGRKRAELFMAADARRLLSTLPLVEPEAPVLEVEAERRRTAPRAFAGVLAIAAAWLLILGFGAGTAALDIVPPVDDLVNRHAAADPLDADDGFDEVDMETMDEEDLEPTSLPGEMAMTAVFHRGTVTQLLYSDGVHDVSLFRQRGSVDWSALPDDGGMMDMPDGDKAWMAERTDGSVLVLQRGDSVITVVTDPDMDMMDDISSMVPDHEDGPSVLDRARGGVRRFLDLVSPGL